MKNRLTRTLAGLVVALLMTGCAPNTAELESGQEFQGTIAKSYDITYASSPPPHWTAYDAKRFNVELPADAPRMNQERAYTSPIWYTPGN